MQDTYIVYVLELGNRLSIGLPGSRQGLLFWLAILVRDIQGLFFLNCGYNPGLNVLLE